MKIKTEFFNKLSTELEKHFEKGECCKNCNAKLPCRSKALVLMAYSNIFLADAIKRAEKRGYEKGYENCLSDVSGGVIKKL